jgi:IMP dehydrogenase/GMP reductase
MLLLLLPAATTLLNGGMAKLSTSATKTASVGRPVRGFRMNTFICHS